MGEQKKPRRKLSTVKIDADWKDAIGRAIRKKKPADRWPELPKAKRKTKKKRAASK